MEEEQEARLLALFDFYWFDRTVLLSSPFGLSSHGVVATRCTAAEPPAVPLEATGRCLLRDEVAVATSSDSALLAHRTVLSGKATSEVEEEQGEGEVAEEGSGMREQARGRMCCRRKHMERRRACRRGGRSKSLSELEFEELKGFMDLGFDFSEAEPDQRLLSIVPGLQRLGRQASSAEEVVGAEKEEEGEGGAASSVVPRPYLSEAWEAVGLEERSRRSGVYDHLLRNWRVPAAGDGVDMKGHLRCWAHTVASAVR